jgi:hypothetical protein
VRSSAIFFFVFASLFAWADDWTTSDGTVYKNIKVVSHDAAFVTVMDDDGGARIALSDLPTEVQKQFDYDPVKAKADAAAVLAQDQRENEERQAEAKAALAQQAASSAMAPVVLRAHHMSPMPPPQQAPAPSVAPVATDDSPPAPKAPAVDVLANTEQIRLDQEKLDSISQDICVAQRDVALDNSAADNYDRHTDNTGTSHPNHVGTSPEDLVASLQKQQSDLQAEIAQLQQENARAPQSK